MHATPVHILIVEDNATDLMIMREAFADSKLNPVLHVASNGEDAMKFLRRVGEHAAAPRPDLILLDLNMPRKNGLEVLTEIKIDKLWLRIPVVIITTSEAEDDVSHAYAAHANCYIRKPVDFERFDEVIRAIEHYWFDLVTLPAAKPHS